MAELDNVAGRQKTDEPVNAHVTAESGSLICRGVTE